MLLFFFSSRRRHTISLRDWSSDVCSSDLSQSLGALIFRNVEMATTVLESDDVVDQYRDRIFERQLQRMTGEPGSVSPGRSEERRVGKECISRVSPKQYK